MSVSSAFVSTVNTYRNSSIKALIPDTLFTLFSEALYREHVAVAQATKCTAALWDLEVLRVFFVGGLASLPKKKKKKNK